MVYKNQETFVFAFFSTWCTYIFQSYIMYYYVLLCISLGQPKTRQKLMNNIKAEEFCLTRPLED